MKKIKIGIVGCGAIGIGLAQFIDKELGSKAALEAVCDIDKNKALALCSGVSAKPKVMELERLVKSVDFVIESATGTIAGQVLDRAIYYRKAVMILSVGALIRDRVLVERAKRSGVNVYIPSGAICGVDGLSALSLGNIKNIFLTTSKPPKGFLEVEYLKRKKINLDKLDTAKVVFKGGVKEAIEYFPKNINVAATLMLASDFRNVNVCIKVDPALKRNVHCIEIVAQEARIKIEIDNVASKLNPKTSMLTVLSAQALLKKIFSSFKIGN